MIPEKVETKISIRALLSNRFDMYNCVGAKTLRKALDDNNIKYAELWWGSRSGHFIFDGKLYNVESVNKKNKSIDMMLQFLPRTVYFEIKS